MKKRIFLLTGFLGSGKTTFLENILKQMTPVVKTGVIVNEFGRAGIDGQLVASNGLDVHELTGGSVFCACLKQNFVDAINTFLDMELDVLFIEASGLSNPAGFHQTAAFLGKQDCIAAVEVICLVDGQYFTEQLDMFNSVETQTATADIIILNKTDLITPDKLLETRAAIRAINPAAEIIETTYGQIDLSRLNAPATAHHTLDENEQPDMRPFTHTLVASQPVPEESLRAFLKEMSGYSLRIKGFLNCRTETGIALKKVDVIGKTINLCDFYKPADTRLVIIANSALPVNRKIQELWEANCNGGIRLI